MKIGIEAQRIFRKNKHGMDYVVLQEIRELQQGRTVALRVQKMFMSLN